jgi:hypothetical protein
MAKNKKKVEEKVEKKVKVVASKDLLRNASTGVFSEGKAPAGKSPSGNRGGVPYWEV